MPNLLANETSPYLLQHKDNPVDWYPWGEDAFARARAEDRPILLSIGYSACHWCHVMAHESFEDAATAELMNRWFVNVKVDREERPDVDGVYMSAVQALTGSGGWPMTVFMTADGRPFYAGTYYPPEDRWGKPGFPRLLHALQDAWVTERERLLASADEITSHLRAAATRASGAGGDLLPEEAARAVDLLRGTFDASWGGFGGAPKFPSPSNLEFLLSHIARVPEETGDPAAVEMVRVTLERMWAGGMYDHLGGGFARYSTDERWLVPHFEKMLYDNAQLARLYLHAYQATGLREERFAAVVRETLGYLVREMRHPLGGFFAAQDADSEGIEGKYFVWTPGELAAVLGDDAPFAMALYGVSEAGNFQDPHHPEFGGRNVLSRALSDAQLAAVTGVQEGDLPGRIEAVRSQLLKARERRMRPGLDDKVLTSWNGLALAAFAECGRVLRNREWVELARQNAAFVQKHLWRDGVLFHTWKDPIARVPGLLEDYAYYGLGLVELYRATGDVEHLEWARQLFAAILERFPDREGGGFFETPVDGEALILRQKSFFDAATPSGTAATGKLAYWLARYYGRREWEEVAHQAVRQVHGHLLQAVTGFGATLQLGELLLARHEELVIVGEPEARAAFEAVAAERWTPWLALAPGRPGTPLPLFDGRAPGAGAQAYLCEDMVCQLPAATPDELGAQMAEP